MRPIKFRFIVKDNEGKINLSKPYELDMEEGIPHRDFILDDMEKGCTSNCANESDNTCYCPSEFDEGEIIDRIQFIGIKDKNKKEIYEGDRLKFFVDEGFDDGEYVGEVVFVKGCFSIKISKRDKIKGINDSYKYDIGQIPDVCEFEKTEVIGNIYENIEQKERD